MTEALGRGIVQGIEQTKPELLKVILQLGLDSDNAIEELTKMLRDGRVICHEYRWLAKRNALWLSG